MIFVTVGTHEQGMDRLLIELDRLIENNLINPEVIAQIGYSEYKPKNYQYSELISYEEMDELVKKADIVITHGGPGSIFHAIQYKKVPIVVPRNPMYNEHVDDHQILFAKRLENEKKIIAVYEISELLDIISNYDDIKKKRVYKSTQKKEFIKKFDELIKVKLRLL
ncbi:MAG: glycosyl transferase family 28 [Bacilli bacterium]|nr:glycosyl transferase family 28 [Bacilli bacterium]